MRTSQQHSDPSGKPAVPPVLFRIPKLETPQIADRVPAEPTPSPLQRLGTLWRRAELPVATQVSAAVLATGVLAWTGWFSVQLISSRSDRSRDVAEQTLVDGPDEFLKIETGTPTLANDGTGLALSAEQRPTANDNPPAQVNDFAAIGHDSGPAETEPSPTADRNPSPSAAAELAASWPNTPPAERDRGSVPSSTPTDSNNVQPSAHLENTAQTATGWATTHASPSETETAGYLKSPTPNAPQFDPERFADGGRIAAGNRPGPAMSTTPHGIEDWTRYLTPSTNPLLPASANLPSASNQPSGATSGKALYIDPAARSAETGAGGFYR